MPDIVNIYTTQSSASSILTTLLPTLLTFGSTIGAAVVGLTIFKWYESWHSGELASRAIAGITSNFARHSIYNMVRITESYERSPFEVPSQSLLKKQEFVLTVLSDDTKDRMQLIGTDLIFKLEHLYLRLRNFNIEIEFVRNNVPQSDDDLKKILDYIFLRNMRLALAYKIAAEFDAMIKRL